MKAIIAAVLLAVLLVSGCCCCCGPSTGGSGNFFNFTQETTPKGDECSSDMYCNDDERCINGYCE